MEGPDGKPKPVECKVGIGAQVVQDAAGKLAVTGLPASATFAEGQWTLRSEATFTVSLANLQPGQTIEVKASQSDCEAATALAIVGAPAPTPPVLAAIAP